MKPRNQEQKPTEPQTKARKPRFRIEKLEHRIAPRLGYHVPHPHNHGHCGHGACK